MQLFIECFGWYGTIALLGSYFCLTRGWLRQEDRIFHFLNCTGAIGIGIAALDKSNYQTVVIEIIFSAIALWATFYPPKLKTEETANQ